MGCNTSRTVEISADTHVSLQPTMKVKEGKEEELFKLLTEVYPVVQNGTKKCLYFGFARDPEFKNVFEAREGYEDAEGVLQHMANVKSILGEMLKLADLTNVKIFGPASELEKLKEPMKDFGPEFWPTDQRGMLFKAPAEKRDVDSHVTIEPFFHVAEGKGEDFKKVVTEFLETTKAAGNKHTEYYGFASSGSGSFYCREGYSNAQGVLDHLNDVGAIVKGKAVPLCSSFSVRIVGPKAELDKLREPITAAVPNAVYWELLEGAMVAPCRA